MAGHGIKEGVLVVTSVPTKPLFITPGEEFETRMYDCGQLLAETMATAHFNREFATIQLCEFAINTLGHGAWDENASVSTFGDLLVVRQTSERHEALKQSLADLKKMATVRAKELDQQNQARSDT